MLWLIFILLLVSLLYFFSRHLDWGWYILVFLSPLIHWIFYFSKYYYFFTENFPWLLGVYAPVVEFWTLFLFCAYLLYLGRQWARGEAVKIYLPGIGWFLLFVGTALVSLVNVYPLEIFASLWYLLHFIVFFYFGYIVLGANIIKNKKILERSLQILAGMGVLAILMGWASIIFGKWRELYSFPRITPFALGNFAPFGDQHIFLAEILTMVLPIFAYFWYVQRRERKNWLAGGSILVLFTALGTLSRSAWVTVLQKF